MYALSKCVHVSCVCMLVGACVGGGMCAYEHERAEWALKNVSLTCKSRAASS